MLRHAFIIIAAMLFTAASAQAGEQLAVSAGSFDVLDNDNSTNFGIEYRGDSFYKGLGPIAGVTGNTDGGWLGYTGFNWDFFVAQNCVITPSLAVAGYSQGDSKDLGGALEFRSGIETSYRFDNQQRVGVAFHHISNAGIYDHNPGVETLMATYSFPMQVFGEK